MTTLFSASLLLVVGFVVLACAKGTPLQPIATRPLGMVVHHLNAAKADTLRSLGVTALRIPYYGDLSDLLAQLSLATGFQVVIVAMVPLSDTLVANIPQGVIVQDGNEPADPIAAGAQFRQDYAQYHDRVALWPPGLSNTVDAFTFRRALNAGLGDAGIVCLHAYGDPLSQAILDRVTMFARATDSLPNPPALVLTEIGTLDVREGDLGPALNAVPWSVRAWVYDLDGSDGFALTANERNTIATFTGAIP